MKARIVTITTPWDGTTTQIVLAPDVTRYDREQLLEQRRCMYGVCNNPWTFLVVGKQKGYIKYAYCWHCMELRLLREILSGVDHKLQDRIWVIEKGKLKKAGSWMEDVNLLVKNFKKRLLAKK